MRKFVWLIVPLLLAVACNKDRTRYIAKVGDAGIERAFFEKQVQRGMKQFGPQADKLTATQRYQFRKRLMEQFIDRELLLAQVKRLAIQADEKIVNENMEQIRRSFPNPEAYKKQLQEQGFNEEEVRGLIRDQVAVNELVKREISDKIKVSETEIQDFYDKNKEQFSFPEMVRVSHIQINCVKPENTPEAKAAKAKLEGVRRELAAKKITFADAAAKYSDCPSKKEGGDLRYIQRGQGMPEFEKIAFNQKLNELSPIIHTQLGYHVLIVTDHKQAGVVKLEEASARIRQNLVMSRTNEGFQKYMNDLKAKTKIETFLEEAPKETAAPAPTAPKPQAPAQPAAK